MSDVSIRTLILEFVDSNGASHIREMHIEILRQKPGTPEHTIRARLSEAVSNGLLNRLGEGFYDMALVHESISVLTANHPFITLWSHEPLMSLEILPCLSRIRQPIGIPNIKQPIVSRIGLSMRNLFGTEVILLFGLAKMLSSHGHPKRTESGAANQFTQTLPLKHHYP